MVFTEKPFKKFQGYTLKKWTCWILNPKVMQVDGMVQMMFLFNFGVIFRFKIFVFPVQKNMRSTLKKDSKSTFQLFSCVFSFGNLHLSVAVQVAPRQKMMVNLSVKILSPAAARVAMEQ